MAELLKREYDLVVLKTELRQGPRSEGSIVLFTLQVKLQGKLTDIRQWRANTGDLGFATARRIANAVDATTRFALPQNIVSDLREFFDLETDRNRALWVHLVKPYGLLRYVPWERLLGEALQVPVLMLPDFIFPRPRESASAFEVALCASAPLGHEDYWMMESTRVSARRILASASRPIRLHIFVDGERADELRHDLLPLSHSGREIQFHDNKTAEKYCTEDASSRLFDKVGVLRSPWLLWMRDELRTRSVDVVHFACHGYLSGDRGAILFAQAPLYRTARYLAGPVGYAELQTFLTQIGAWSSVFTCLPDNNSEAGLRALADDIAQSRPGPLMMHTLNTDRDGSALEQGYRFLYGRTPMPAPKSSALFVYCQPYLVAATSAVISFGGKRRGAAMRGVTATAGPEPLDLISGVTRNDQQRQFIADSQGASALDSVFVQQDNVAPWVASTERFAEQIQLRYQKLARDQVLSKDVADQRMQLALDTIGKLRAAVSNFSDRPEKPK